MSVVKTPSLDCLCLGIDPNIAKFPSLAFQACNTNVQECLANPQVAIEVVQWYCTQLITAAQLENVRVLKFQAAWFEAHGASGLKTLAALLSLAKSLAIKAIVDAKRGDFAETNNAYAQAWLSTRSDLVADAITINPFLGIEALRPFFDLAAENKKRLYVLIRTSNPEGDIIQNAQVGQRKLWQYLLEQVCTIDAEGLTAGFVVGAQRPNEVIWMKEEGFLKQHSLLVPGFGAQGGNLHDAAKFFNATQGPVYFSNSRALSYPAGIHNATSADELCSVIAQAIATFRLALTQAVQ